MKKIIILVTAFLLAALCANAHKYALIIAVGNYDQNKTGWYPISADHDVPLIQKTLVGLGFKEEDMKEVGEIIAMVLSDVENESVKEEARQRVAALCEKYPLY